ncbi:MAG: carbohydrate kinase family protein [Deinococcota bacterium]
MSKFFVVGDVTVDQMIFVDELPEAGSDVSAKRALVGPGGAGGTMATVLARLGNDTTIATKVGGGPFADLAFEYVRASKVNTKLVQVDSSLPTSSVTLLITPDTQRTMVSYSGASRKLDAAKLKTDDVASCDALVMSAYSLVGGLQREYAVKALDIAKQAKLTTFIDMGSGAVESLRDRLISLLRDVDYLLMNQHELFTLTGESSISEAVEGLADQGIERVIVKVGEMGSIVVTPELTELVDAWQVDGVLDTTGAGDYFTAAFAHGIMQGYDLYYAAKLGNIAGALNATHVGAQTCMLNASLLEQHAEDLLAVESR